MNKMSYIQTSTSPPHKEGFIEKYGMGKIIMWCVIGFIGLTIIFAVAGFLKSLGGGGGAFKDLLGVVGDILHDLESSPILWFAVAMYTFPFLASGASELMKTIRRQNTGHNKSDKKILDDMGITDTWVREQEKTLKEKYPEKTPKEIMILVARDLYYKTRAETKLRIERNTSFTDKQKQELIDAIDRASDKDLRDGRIDEKDRKDREVEGK